MNSYDLKTQHPPVNLVDNWEPGCWVVACLKLCDEFREESRHEVLRYPEQWAYFLWRPAARSLAGSLPDCFALTVGEPWADLPRSVGDAPVYRLADAECDWPSWLEIILVCDKSPDWLRDLMRIQYRLKREERRKSLQCLYGAGEDFTFERFMRPLLQPLYRFPLH